MTSSAGTVLDAATGDIGDDDFDELDDRFDRSADADALADELSILASLERTIRWAQAEQYRLIESAHVPRAPVRAGRPERRSGSARRWPTRGEPAKQG